MLLIQTKVIINHAVSHQITISQHPSWILQPWMSRHELTESGGFVSWSSWSTRIKETSLSPVPLEVTSVFCIASWTTRFNLWKHMRCHRCYICPVGYWEVIWKNAKEQLQSCTITTCDALGRYRHRFWMLLMHFPVQDPWFYSVAYTEFNPFSPCQRGSILTQTPTILLIACFAQDMESDPSTPPGWDFQHEGYGHNHPQTPRRNGEANSDDLNLMLKDLFAFCRVLQSANHTNW